MVILQCAQHVTKSCDIWRRFDQRMDVWEVREHEMLAEDTARTYAQYLSTSRGENSLENRAKIYHSLVLCGKIRLSVI